MFTTILLRALTILILVDGMSTQSLDRLESGWITGGFLTLRDEGARDVLTYPSAEICGTEAARILVQGNSESDAPTLADLLRIRHGYNSRTIVIAQEQEMAEVLGRHCADRVLVVQGNDSVVDMATVMTRRFELGTGRDNDLLILQLTAFRRNAQSDILVSDADERAYYDLNAKIGRLLYDLPAGDARQYIMVGIPRYGVGADLMQKVHYPMQSVDSEQILALANAYLMALHGNQKWIDGIEGQTIRLNQTLMATKDVNPVQVAQELAAFVREMTAIEDAEIDRHGNIHYRLKRSHTPYWGAPFVTYPIITLPKRNDIHKAEDLINKI